MKELLRFGHLAAESELSSKRWAIATLPGTRPFSEIRMRSAQIDHGWIYPPVESRPFAGRSVPFRAARWFGLDPSHSLIYDLGELSCEIARDLILYYGFLEGLHLMPLDGGYLQRTAIEPGKLVRFSSTPAEKTWLIDRALDTFLSVDDELRSSLRAVLNLFLLGQCYCHEYERFESQCRVLDGIGRLARQMGFLPPDPFAGTPRAPELADLCRAFRIPAPAWAENERQESVLACRRNELIYEALHIEKPMGLDSPKAGSAFELTRYNEMFILRIMGADSRIFKAPPGITWESYPLELDLQ